MRKWKKCYGDRLLKLANHLENWRKDKKVGHKEFNFSTISTSESTDVCGSAGCAVGELPVVFPRHFKYDKIGEEAIAPVLKKDNDLIDFAAAEVFFDLEKDDVYGLFAPNSQQSLSNYYETLFKSLPAYATPKQVARNIRKFVKVKRRLYNGTEER